ncbi:MULTISPECIES: osmotically-inducible lipoprotein OsmE [Pseudomonas]|uniref:osmotically-inducible lipoprotein OsmE n=1 Tax=Pseudomonadaceae TaxID=135621 RepID=UPI00041893F0|nr:MULTISPECIES: osmotically-inducible lipoprotein OsmE [Pseudomonas]MDE3737479.1 osmotically-inducible lipoprotein OsmE [Pseudomonas resinovorans]
MSKQAILLACALASTVGCASKMENPTDYYTYRNQPLVKQVDEGMTETQVRNVGGPPSSSIRRKVNPGVCNNYILNQDGHQQAYHVSFDGSGRVEEQGFMTCEQREQLELEKAQKKVEHGGGY